MEHVSDADRDGAGNNCFRAEPKPPEPEDTPAEDLLEVNTFLKKGARSGILMQFAAVQQPLRDVRSLKRGPLGRRMGRKVAATAIRMCPPWRCCPFPELAHASLEHLVGVKACILPKQRVRESRDQLLGRVTQGEMARDNERPGIDLPLAIECAQARPRGFPRSCREGRPADRRLPGQPRGRHIQVAGEIDRHRPVEHAPGRLDPAIRSASSAAGSASTPGEWRWCR